MSYMTEWVDKVAEKTELKVDDHFTLVLLYALLAKTKQATVTPEDVHDAWSLWTEYARGFTDHKSLIPFDELTPEVQSLDNEYVEAIQHTFKEMRDGI